MKSLIIILLTTTSFYAQNSCDKAEDNFEDISTPTKCTIKETKDKGQIIDVKVYASKKRFRELKNANSLILKRMLSKKMFRSAKTISSVESLPLFKNCEGSSIECFNSEMIKHIETNFHYPEEALKAKMEGKVWVRFIIDVDGYVSNIKAITIEGKQHAILEDEARRVASLIPRLKPGQHNGVNIPIKYGFPIQFKL